MTSTGVQVPFLHGFPIGPTGSQTELASLERADEWLNSPPLTPAALRGKVVLIDFWTYTCINWRRTLPYVRAWAEKYKDQGLVVVGVHAPEFSFEKNLSNVRWAVKDLGIDYPVAVDNDHAIWRAFRNQYWPALYFIDAQGRVRHHHFGEGEYEQSEMIIQALLREAGASSVSREPVKVDARGLDVAADWGNLKSPENYVGFARTENFASPGGAALDKPRMYELPARLRLNEWALSGDWTVKKEAAVLNKAGGRITYRFHARDLHLVMGPAAPGTSVKFRVLIDGQPPGAAHGVDVDEQGNGTVTEQRLYQLIRQPKPIADRQFEIEFLRSWRGGFRVHVRLIRRDPSSQGDIPMDTTKIAQEINRHRRYFIGGAAAAAAAAQLGMIGLAAAQPANTRATRLPAIKPGTHTSFAPLKQIDAGVLNVGYAEAGPADGPPVILLHGWPYDIYAFVDVAPLLASAGYRVIIPYLRGYGTTRFLSSDTVRNGQPSALASDVIALMDALKIEKATLAGFDWGARTVNIVSALWPERVKATVSVSGYLIGSQDAGRMPLPPKAELEWWYQYYFATERGRAGYDKYRRDFSKLIWQIASPKWDFDDATFDRSAAAFDNPDHVAIVIHNYRWRLGLADGEAKYDDLEKRLAEFPVIAVPTITMEGDANGAPHPDPSAYAKKFSGKYEHRLITGGIGHNLPQEAPQAFAQAVIDVAGEG